MANDPGLDKQKLIDISFQLVEETATNDVIKRMSREDRMAWVRDQLRKCGFNVQSVGSSWGVLLEDRQLK